MEIWTGTIKTTFEMGREVVGLFFKGELFPWPLNVIGIRVECEGPKERTLLFESICRAVGLERPEQLREGYPVRLACTYEEIPPGPREHEGTRLITIRAIGRVVSTGNAEDWCVMPVKQSAWARREGKEEWYEVDGDWNADNLIAQLLKFDAESNISNEFVEDITIRVKLKQRRGATGGTSGGTSGGAMEISFSPQEFCRLHQTVRNIARCMSGAYDSVNPNLITAQVTDGGLEIRPPINEWRAMQVPPIEWLDSKTIKDEPKRSRFSA